ncbi:hypothetical protein BH11CYA1_BH11CYA1_40590 [soil metagenome]
MSILSYYQFVVPILFPWIIVVLLCDLWFARRGAVSQLSLEAPEASTIASFATFLSFILCMPIALLAPIWTLLFAPLYWILAVGIHYQVLKEFHPDFEKKLMWRWAYSSNNLGWSFFAALGSLLAARIC